jgi:hypothetical protein
MIRFTPRRSSGRCNFPLHGRRTHEQLGGMASAEHRAASREELARACARRQLACGDHARGANGEQAEMISG